MGNSFKCKIKVLWAHQDSNLEPTHYECGALTVELWARKGLKLVSEDPS